MQVQFKVKHFRVHKKQCRRPIRVPNIQIDKARDKFTAQVVIVVVVFNYFLEFTQRFFSQRCRSPLRAAGRISICLMLQAFSVQQYILQSGYQFKSSIVQPGGTIGLVVWRPPIPAFKFESGSIKEGPSARTSESLRPVFPDALLWSRFFCFFQKWTYLMGPWQLGRVRSSFYAADAVGLGEDSWTKRNVYTFIALWGAFFLTNIFYLRSELWFNIPLWLWG